MRVLVTGVGDALGARVVQLLEARDDVDEIVACDAEPTRRRFARAAVHRTDPRDGAAIADLVAGARADALAHLAVDEPGGRADDRVAASSTASWWPVVGAAVAGGRLDRVALRSGIEVYGRGGDRPLVPAEDAPLAPTTPFGASCVATEAAVARAAHGRGVAVAALRFAPVVGRQAASPLGRLLRLPAVPVPLVHDPPFSVVHVDDAARAVVEALVRRVDGACNVVGPGATSPRQAARLGGRVVVPVAGALWGVAARAAGSAGAPLPAHVVELLRRGRVADGSHAVDALGLQGWRATPEVVAELHDPARVVRMPAPRAAA